MKVAVIGGGISGLGTAWALKKVWLADSSVNDNSVTVFEEASYIGGHTNTVYITPEQVANAFPTLDPKPNQPIAVDTGFIVYNDGNYPNLLRFWKELGVESTNSDMSFSVSINGIEWGSDGLSGLFAQKKNLFSPVFWRFVWDMFRFNAESQEVINNPKFEGMTLGEYFTLRGYSRAFLEWYLLPMTGAIWSTPQSEMKDFPIQSMLVFFNNHKLLQIYNRWQWRTILNGSIEYVKRVTKFIGEENFRTNCRITSIERHKDGKITLFDSQNNPYPGFDKVVFACHADTALAILGSNATEAERDALGAFEYKRNTATLHSDTSFMPVSQAAWTSWNVLSPYESPVMQLTYWMNRLQPWIARVTPVFVTLNATRQPDPSKVYSVIKYDHPVFTVKSVKAQAKIKALQGQLNTYYAGAHLGFGFHEDGFTHGLLVAQQITGKAPFEISLTRYSPHQPSYTTIFRHIQTAVRLGLRAGVVVGLGFAMFKYLSSKVRISVTIDTGKSSWKWAN